MRNQVWSTVTPTYGTFDWLRREVAHKIGYNADHNLLGRTERARVDSIIQSGVMQFASASWPAMPPGMIDQPVGEGRNPEVHQVEAKKEAFRRPPHRWSFLHKVHTITTAVGYSDYALPADFGGWIGEPTSIRGGGRIAIAAEAHIRQLQSSSPSSGKPAYCATRQTSTGGATVQATEILFYPTPDAIEAIQVEYSVNPVTLDDANQYPPGGLEHAETVLAYCFYTCAQRDGAGIQEAAVYVQDRLTASIAIDKANAKPTTDGVWLDDDGTFNAAYLSRMIGRKIGAGPNPAAWTHQQEQLIAESLRRARRKVYNPPLVFGEKVPHDWSFLRPLTSITLTQGEPEYDLPADFASLLGNLTHGTDGDTLYPPIQYVGENVIREKLQREETSTRPVLAAIRVKPHSDAIGTRYQLIFWPIPDKEYSIDFRYRVNPDTSGADSLPALVDNLDLHGGDRFSEMYLEAAMLSADQLMEVGRSVHQDRFMRAVETAVGSDRVTNTPDSLGYNSDPGSESEYSRGDVHDWSSYVVSHNGINY